MERPILFSGSMVRAILDGKKTMTRRVVKHQDCEVMNQRPYKPGDRLWVRETWATRDPIWDDDKAESFMIPATVDHGMIIYRADGEQKRRWRPSIFMPRWASRITLEITSVRVERLQEITEKDARAEGIIDGGCLNCGEHEPCGCNNPQPDARDSFVWLWDSIYGKKYPWSSNPFVWVIEFRRGDDLSQN